MTNLVIVSVDDLAYWIGSSSVFSGGVHAPNLQKLAASGITFSNAYTPEPLCNAARTSFFTGLSPNVTGVHSNTQSWLDQVAPASTLPAIFKQHGYDSAGFGKVLHNFTLPASAVQAMFTHYAPVSGYQGGAPATSFLQPLPAGVREQQLTDHVTIDQAIAFLDARNPSKPFVLNVGLVKPHLDWIVPQEYFDLYPLEHIQVPGLVGDDMSGVPAFIRDQLVDSRGHATPNDVHQAKLFVQGYLASVSYADAQLGRLLDKLAAAGLYDDSVITFWSDNGYHLGDRANSWGKFTLWEEAAKVPLIVKLAGNERAGTILDDVVNLVDAMPTLLGLAGLTVPPGLSGDSLVPLLYGNGPAAGDGASLTWMYGSVMLRTPTHAYMRYEDGSEELYDMISDPAQLHNLATLPEQGALLVSLRDQALDKADILVAGSGMTTGSDAAEAFIVNQSGAVVHGRGGNDRYYVNAEGSSIVETASGGLDVVFTTVNFRLPDHVESLVVPTYTGGRVTFLAGNSLPNRITAAAGSERIYGGAGNDTIRGGGGMDTIYGEDGNDYLQGWSGRDLIFGGAGNDVIQGLNGNDELHGDEGDDVIVLGTGAGIAYGGQGNDRLSATGGSAVLDGGLGADTLVGGATGEFIAGYGSATSGVRASLARPETNTGDARGDVYTAILGLQGSMHADELEGDDRANTLRGENGNDTLRGGAGDDWLSGGPGADLLDGGAGFDTVQYIGLLGLRADMLLPGTNTGDATGDTYLSIELLRGTAGNDTLLGLPSAEVIEGSDGNDLLYGRGGNDTLRGGAGDDWLNGGLGADLLDGGRGFDTVHYIGLLGLRADMLLPGTNTGEATGDSYLSIELLRGTAGNDTLLGLPSADVIEGSEGNDLLYGRAGNDTLRGGAGDDWLNGGPGTDLLDGGPGFDTVHYTGLLGLRADMLLPGTNTGDATGDTYLSIELLRGTTGNDTLLGLPSADVIEGSEGNDMLYGRGGNDTVRGDTGNDFVDAGAGEDSVTGGAGDDSLFGGIGNDVLVGGSGNDRLAGGDGADVFVFDAAFSTASNVDVVLDFEHGVDKLLLGAGVFRALAGQSGLSAAQFSGSGGLVSASTPEQRILYDTATGRLYYDADGNGTGSGPVLFAHLPTKPLLGLGDFLIA